MTQSTYITLGIAIVVLAFAIFAQATDQRLVDSFPGESHTILWKAYALAVWKFARTDVEFEDLDDCEFTRMMDILIQREIDILKAR